MASFEESISHSVNFISLRYVYLCFPYFVLRRNYYSDSVNHLTLLTSIKALY